MFEKEISGYAFNITKRYTGDRVPLSEILADIDLPDSFKRFAEAEVEEAIDQEGIGESRTGKFDLKVPEVKALFKEVRHILKSSYEFSREEFMDVSDRASKFVFNYAVRPKWTMEKFLFKGGSEITKNEIERASRYFSDYQYYSKGITEYLDFHGKESLDLETWRKLHSKIDEHLLSTLPAKANTIATPVFMLFDFSAGEEKVPIDAVILFFRDKSADEIVDRLEFAKEVKNIQAVDVITFTAILEATSKDVNVDIAVLHPPQEPPKEFRTFERQTMTNPLRPQVFGAPKLEDLPKVSVAQPAKSASVENVAAPPVGSGAAAPETRPMDKQLSEESASAIWEAKISQAPRTPSVRNYIPEKVETRIVKKIFRGSRSGYQIALHKLDEAPDWQSASKLVEGIFIDNDVDPFSKYAVAFTDAVSTRFRAKK